MQSCYFRFNLIYVTLNELTDDLLALSSARVTNVIKSRHLGYEQCRHTIISQDKIHKLIDMEVIEVEIDDY